jgi:hypothetical protein
MVKMKKFLMSVCLVVLGIVGSTVPAMAMCWQQKASIAFGAFDIAGAIVLVRHFLG